MIVFATCHDESTKNSFAIAESIVENEDIFLEKEKAVKNKLAKTLQEFPNLSLFGFCHGKDESWIGNDNSIAFDISQAPYLENRKIYAYACRTSNSLGLKLADVKDCFYWGYNNTILAGDDEFLQIISPIIKFIKINFQNLDTSDSILSFLKDLKEKCDSSKEKYTAHWASDNSKYGVIAHLTQALRDIWAKLVVSFHGQFISHEESIEPLLW